MCRDTCRVNRPLAHARCMPTRRVLVLASLGILCVATAAVLIATIDPDCDASGSYGNYCGLQQPHIWGYPLGLVGVALLVGAWISSARSSRGA